MSSMNHQLKSDQTKEVINKMAGIDKKDIDCSRLVIILKLLLIKSSIF